MSLPSVSNPLRRLGVLTAGLLGLGLGLSANAQACGFDLGGGIDTYYDNTTPSASAGAIAGESAEATPAPTAEQLFNQGAVAYQTGHYQAAFGAWVQALQLYQASHAPLDEALTMSSLGTVFKRFSDYSAALNCYQQALTIFQDLEEPLGEAQSLNYLGEIYIEQGHYLQAKTHYEAAQAIFEDLAVSVVANPPPAEAYTLRFQAINLDNLGILYGELGQYTRALDFHQQALAIRQTLAEPQFEKITLLNIGLIYKRLENYSTALTYYEQALAISRDRNDRRGEAIALNNLALVYDELGEPTRGLEYLQTALAIYQEMGDRMGEGNTLDSLGTLYLSLGQYDQAQQSYEQALTILRAVGQRALEKAVLGHIGDLYVAQDQPELAIVFYKQSVELTEALRQTLQTLSREQQEAYAATVEATYRSLADLLLEQGRILEAQQVLELLKVEELRQFTRASYSTGSLIYDPEEVEVMDGYNSLIAIGADIAACHPNCDEALYNRRRDLLAYYQQQIASFKAVVAQNRAEDDRFYDPTDLASDALDIVNAQPGTVLIYPVVLPDKLWLLWTATGGVVGTVEVPVSQAELSQAVLQLQQQLRQPDAQSLASLKSTSHQLYQWLIAPLATELQQNQVEHLVFAQDRITRYVPMAALHDGERFLIERYTVSTVLSAALTDTDYRLEAAESSPVLALGLNQSIPGYSPLPKVTEEVDGIVRTDTNDLTGVFPGQIFLNDQFTLDTLDANLRRARILHIATHAEFVPQVPAGSYLLLGNGEQLPISEIRSRGLDLDSLHLVVLSACQTALGGEALDGTEIAGVSSYFLGKNKAEAVMATLWRVDDAGTSLLMQRFYGILATGQVTKAEALRQAQLSLLNNEVNLEERFTMLGLDRGGFVTAEVNSEPAGLDHPYYWAPFILIGNGL